MSSSFLSELRRRRVFRVAIAYAFVAFVVGEVADIFLPALNLPDWSVTLVVALLVLGFPVAVVLAWAYQVTPEGVVRDEGSTSTAPPQGRGASGGADAGVVVAAPGGSTEAAPSIGVLAFADMSPDQDQEYLGDGISEEIIDALTKLPGLKVAARTSAFTFKGSDADVREIGRRLGVGAVLEGSVRKAGDRLRITAQLISVEDGYHLWSERYDRTLDDVFEIQDGIARAVVEALRVKLIGDSEALVRPTTTNAQAYDLYLKGRHAWRHRYQLGLEAALRYFEQAIALDPDFAEPHAGVCDTYCVLGIYGIGDQDEAGSRAGAAVARALEMGPDVPDVRFAAGLHAQVFRWDLQAAVDHYRAAIRLGGRHPRARGWLGITLAVAGDKEAGYNEARGAWEEAPDSVYIRSILVLICATCGRHEEAREHTGRILEVEPTDLLSRYALGCAESARGNHDEAVELMSFVYERSPAPAFAALLAAALAAAARDQEAEALRRRVVEASAGAETDAIIELWSNVFAKRLDEAFAALERQVNGRMPGLLAAIHMPQFDALRADPRWSVIQPFLDIE